MKRCIECHLSKPHGEFNANKARRDGLQQRCRLCDNARAKRYYAANKERMVRQIKSASRSRSQRVKLWVCEYLLSHPCVDCGETDIVVLEFDHVGEKTKTIGKMFGGDHSIAAIEKEISQCEVVCANCHKRRTDKTFGNYRMAYVESNHTEAAPVGV